MASAQARLNWLRQREQRRLARSLAAAHAKVASTKASLDGKAREVAGLERKVAELIRDHARLNWHRDESLSHTALDGAATTLVQASEFDCGICWELLLDPVTAPCGHTFCKHCAHDLRRAGHGAALCPLDRTPIPHGLCITYQLNSTIQHLFPKQSKTRRAELQDQMQEQEGAGATPDSATWHSAAVGALARGLATVFLLLLVMFLFTSGETLYHY